MSIESQSNKQSSMILDRGLTNASALFHARQEAEARERAKWEAVIADKDALIAKLQAQLERRQ